MAIAYAHHCIISNKNAKLESTVYIRHTNKSTLDLALSIQNSQEGTEKYWLQKRRASVAVGASSAPLPALGIAADATRMGMAEWTDGQTRLQGDLEAMHKQALLEAAEDGFLLPCEMTAELRDGVHQMIARRKDADRDGSAADRRAARITVGNRGCIKLSGRKVFIDVGAGDHLHARAREVTFLLLQYNCNLCAVAPVQYIRIALKISRVHNSP